MTPLSLVRMRKAASLAFAIPHLGIGIHHGDDELVRIDRVLDGCRIDATTTLLSPCAFRSAVSRAHQHSLAGGTVLFLGLDADADPIIVYRMGECGSLLAGGLALARLGDSAVYVFATVLDSARVDELLAQVRADVEGDASVTIDRAVDPGTDVTIVYCEAPLGSLPLVGGWIETIMGDLLVSTGIEEIMDRLDGASRART